MYLMKLRYKDFGTDAGAAWRQLAVVALFSWLAKYRVFNEERLHEALEELKERREKAHQNATDFDATGLTAAVGTMAAAGAEAGGIYADTTPGVVKGVAKAAGVDRAVGYLRRDASHEKEPVDEGVGDTEAAIEVEMDSQDEWFEAESV